MSFAYVQFHEANSTAEHLIGWHGVKASGTSADEGLHQREHAHPIRVFVIPHTHTAAVRP